MRAFGEEDPENEFHLFMLIVIAFISLSRNEGHFRLTFSDMPFSFAPTVLVPYSQSACR